MMSVIVKLPGGERYLVAKGAPDVILARTLQLAQPRRRTAHQ